ncbi:hypothetical protein B0H63DRAFT_490241 [Podospora didyma]|uniref:Uncharacterized protein n=1 Tax=Podospora didyma TaxID=330526 RepID=A0AAE0N0I4_9PEZI|nr:hypothetical protein B0H63DRAFT_490241 [Podospora didyma]
MTQRLTVSYSTFYGAQHAGSLVVVLGDGAMVAVPGQLIDLVPNRYWEPARGVKKERDLNIASPRCQTLRGMGYWQVSSTVVGHDCFRRLPRAKCLYWSNHLGPSPTGQARSAVPAHNPLSLSQRPSTWGKKWTGAWAWWAGTSKVQYHLLSKSQLESILNSGISMRGDWLRSLDSSKSADSDGSSSRGQHTTRAGLVLSESELSTKQVAVANLKHLQVAEINYGHMCNFASMDRKAVIDFVSKLAADKKEYNKSVATLKEIRQAIKDSSLVDTKEVLGFELKMDGIADGMLKGLKY